jgi:hypothetical protein
MSNGNVIPQIDFWCLLGGYCEESLFHSSRFASQTVGLPMPYIQTAVRYRKSPGSGCCQTLNRQISPHKPQVKVSIDQCSITNADENYCVLSILVAERVEAVTEVHQHFETERLTADISGLFGHHWNLMKSHNTNNISMSKSMLHKDRIKAIHGDWRRQILQFHEVTLKPWFWHRTWSSNAKCPSTPEWQYHIPNIGHPGTSHSDPEPAFRRRSPMSPPRQASSDSMFHSRWTPSEQAIARSSEDQRRIREHNRRSIHPALFRGHFAPQRRISAECQRLYFASITTRSAPHTHPLCRNLPALNQQRFNHRVATSSPTPLPKPAALKEWLILIFSSKIIRFTTVELPSHSPVPLPMHQPEPWYNFPQSRRSEWDSNSNTNPARRMHRPLLSSRWYPAQWASPHGAAWDHSPCGCKNGDTVQDDYNLRAFESQLILHGILTSRH